MPTNHKPLRILIVDDNRDGADALGLLVEALGNEAHVTYGGTQALDVASAFCPDLILVDLLMPNMNGCELVTQLRQKPGFAHIRMVAVTGLKDEGHKTLALKSGFDALVVKPATLEDINSALASVVPTATPRSRSPKRSPARVSPGTERRLPMDEARRIRSERPSKSLTQAEGEAAICDGVIRFQEEYLGWRSDQVHVHLIKDFALVRIRGALTLAERQLCNSTSSGKGRDLIKQTRKHLLELARPMLASLIHEATGAKVASMHHDISTVTGEEVVLFSLAEMPRFE